MPKNMTKNDRDKSKNIQTLRSNSISFIITSHLSQFRRIHKIFPTNLSLEKLLTPSDTKPPRKKSFSLRPPNGFILYRKDVQQEIMKNNSDVTFKTVSSIASKKWKCESEEKKNFFNSLSRVAHLVYLDICESYVEQNKERINFNLHQVENSKKDSERPWMQSSIFPTMLVSPNSSHGEKNDEIELQKINDDKLDQSFYDDFIKVPSIPPSYNILDVDHHSSIPPPSILNTNVDSSNYYFEIPYIPDFLLNSNSNFDNMYQIPSHDSHESKTMQFDYENDYLYILNNHSSFFNSMSDETL
ncbi:uncharacterized protein OCT59_016675 [Rhizophagus irregularis]|uniref:HMG box domain-containing protein n=2 Tax=Rhizophagus irregularis TaxID=588596 RepID=U9T941_RHIID|nr:hypothetical protein GLOIN_2v1838002 [Rhizophagus irregularis DAOM 181602=DAOM 197198]EXX54155.1 hypothetical protein RirG_237240 [Rhizophagus irregularis DAOM 197198w]UZO24372.1 hypothetical protein OCT59_016675 [Rhizophagus irregularis]EXX74348.1 hypothetical protein RirG_051940 [Rhizophagus irregularis DAOM 197198w]POG76629.1 hypothetical protein GLOIN_2v1838002 [Rhizophagus irregularis DAOM 181602=DAOM 197198]CAG8437625.1 9037_t:CDS:1 [Rhizophagus irregularis]|eukprot:XP_025183495.1 hypothetical protein GLOIN_2v1838002 [Rhizophagus irregularis DAOM 181602=DAOM 197198]